MVKKRESADSILYLRGFKSFSHEASIVYLIKEGFNETKNIIKVSDISDTFGKLKRKISGQEFKDRVRAGW